MFNSFRLDMWMFDVFSYTLIDDEFGKVFGISPSFWPALRYNPTPAPVPGPIIIEYGKRNLNVEGNIALYFFQQCQECNWKIKKVLDYCNTCCSDPINKKSAELWQTVDQSKILKYAVFI